MGRMAIGAMGRKLSTSGSRLSRTTRLDPMSAPSAVPSTRATAKPVTTRPRLSNSAVNSPPVMARSAKAFTTRSGAGAGLLPGWVRDQACQATSNAIGRSDACSSCCQRGEVSRVVFIAAPCLRTRG